MKGKITREQALTLGQAAIKVAVRRMGPLVRADELSVWLESKLLWFLEQLPPQEALNKFGAWCGGDIKSNTSFGLMFRAPDSLEDLVFLPHNNQHDGLLVPLHTTLHAGRDSRACNEDGTPVAPEERWDYA